MPPKEAAVESSAPAIQPGHFAVNVPLPSVVLPELIVAREAAAAVAEIGAAVVSTAPRADGSCVVKICVSKQYAISFYKTSRPDDTAPEAKAIAALLVRHLAERIIARLGSSVERARAAVLSEPAEGVLPIYMFIHRDRG
jgi:hypothetical protein